MKYDEKKNIVKENEKKTLKKILKKTIQNLYSEIKTKM